MKDEQTSNKRLHNSTFIAQQNNRMSQLIQTAGATPKYKVGNMGVTRAQIKGRFETYNLKNRWYGVFYDNMQGPQILSMVGDQYWDLVNYVDPRRMTTDDLLFCRMVMAFPESWRKAIYVEETFVEFAQFLQELWQRPEDPKEAKCFRPKVKKEKLTCPRCQWQGQPSKFRQYTFDHFREIASIKLCPRCFKQGVKGAIKDTELNDIMARWSGHSLGNQADFSKPVTFNFKLHPKMRKTTEIDALQGVTSTKLAPNLYVVHQILTKYPPNYSDYAAISPI